MSQASLEPSVVVEGRYQLESRLEGWGIGEVWKARDKNFRNRPVVVKFLGGGVDGGTELPDIAVHVKNFRGLRHGSILPYINQGSFGPRLWVTQDFFDGVALPQLIDEGRRAKGRLDVAQAEPCFDAVVAALAAAHAAQGAYVHGCLQPSAVIVKRGAMGDLKLLDFGLGPYVTTVYDRETLRPFQAPEQLGRDMALTARADVYALGVLLLDLIAAQPAGTYTSPVESLLTLMGAQGFPASVRAQSPDVPAGIWDAIVKAVQRDPDARFADAGEMREAVRKAWVERAPSVSSNRKPDAPARAAPPAPVPGVGGARVAPPVLNALGTPRPQEDPRPSAPSAAWDLPPLAPGAPQRPLPPPVAAPPLAAPPPAPSPWDPAPVAPLSSAWDTPALPAQPPSPVASAWDPAPATAAVGASLGSAWDPQPLQGVWAPPAASPATAQGWSAGSTLQPQRVVHGGQGFAGVAETPFESTRALDLEAFQANAQAQAKALAGAVPPPRPPTQEATMALDISAFTESADTVVGGAALGAAVPVPVPVKAPAARDDEDWRDSVVVLDTSSARRSGGFAQPAPVGETVKAPAQFAAEDDDFDPLESRTFVAAPSASLDAMQTTVPPRRDLGFGTASANEDQGATVAASRFGLADRPSARVATMPPTRNAAPVAPAAFAPQDPFQSGTSPSFPPEPFAERTQLGIPTQEALTQAQAPGARPYGTFSAPPPAAPTPAPAEGRTKPWFFLVLAGLFLGAIGIAYLVMSMRAR